MKINNYYKIGDINSFLMQNIKTILNLESLKS